jgi:GAF domain-containing protein
MDPSSDTQRRLAALKSAVQKARQMVNSSHALLQRHTRLVGGDGVGTGKAFARFDELLREGSIREALEYLVGLSDYRFISIFRFQDGQATSVVHFDKQNPSVEQADEVPDTATYCSFVRDKNGAFATLDAGADARTAGHVARTFIAAYCGVPILTPEGELIGTLCHYDTVPRDPDQLDLELLLQVSSALARSGKVPTYPVRR